MSAPLLSLLSQASLPSRFLADDWTNAPVAVRYVLLDCRFVVGYFSIWMCRLVCRSREWSVLLFQDWISMTCTFHFPEYNYVKTSGGFNLWPAVYHFYWMAFRVFWMSRKTVQFAPRRTGYLRNYSALRRVSQNSKQCFLPHLDAFAPTRKTNMSRGLVAFCLLVSLLWNPCISEDWFHDYI